MQGDPMKQLFAICALAMCGTAASQDDEQRPNADAVLELTMTLIAANAEKPSAVTATIELPKDDGGESIASERGVERSARGLDTANLARENGAAFGEAAAAAARDNRENASRAPRAVEAQERPSPAPPDRPVPPTR